MLMKIIFYVMYLPFSSYNEPFMKKLTNTDLSFKLIMDYI